MVTYITIEPVSKIEVSAMEIRSRIKGWETTVSPNKESKRADNQQDKQLNIPTTEFQGDMLTAIEGQGKTFIPELSQADSVTSVKDQGQSPNRNNTKVSKKYKLKQNKQSSVDLYVGTRFHSVSLVLLDEASVAMEITEVIRISLDELFVMTHPSSVIHADGETCHTCISACVGAVQVTFLYYQPFIHVYKILYAHKTGYIVIHFYTIFRMDFIAILIKITNIYFDILFLKLIYL